MTKPDRREYFQKYQSQRRAVARMKLWPKCQTCGFIARNLPEIGCLECHARNQPRRNWTDPELEMIEQFAGNEGIACLQWRMYQETGIPRSRWSMHKRFRTEGIKTTKHSDQYTIAQLSELTGKAYHTILKLVRMGIITNQAKGRRVLISHADAEKVIARYAKSDRPSYSLAEAARLLGYNERTLSNAFKRGLPAWKEGLQWRVCKVTIDRAAVHLKTTGNVYIRWRSLASR